MAELSILFFGYLKERFGPARSVTISPGGCTIAELRVMLGDDGDLFRAVIARQAVRAAVDDEIVPEDFRVFPGQQVEFLPPVSGG